MVPLRRRASSAFNFASNASAKRPARSQGLCVSLDVVFMRGRLDVISGQSMMSVVTVMKRSGPNRVRIVHMAFAILSRMSASEPVKPDGRIVPSSLSSYWSSFSSSCVAPKPNVSRISYYYYYYYYHFGDFDYDYDHYDYEYCLFLISPLSLFCIRSEAICLKRASSVLKKPSMRNSSPRRP
jgi:hypothetical protein